MKDRSTGRRGDKGTFAWKDVPDEERPILAPDTDFDGSVYILFAVIFVCAASVGILGYILGTNLGWW